MNTNGTQHKELSAISLAHAQYNKRQRACLAPKVRDGATNFKLSDRWLCAIFGIRRSWLAVGRSLPLVRREAIIKGQGDVSFTALIASEPLLALPAPEPAIDHVKLVQIARVVGTDRMINAAAIAEAAE